MPRKTPHPIQLGSVIQAYVDTVSKHGESEIEKQASATLDKIIYPHGETGSREILGLTMAPEESKLWQLN